jgi:hypothetical protein
LTYGGYEQAVDFLRYLLNTTKKALGIEHDIDLVHLAMMLYMQDEYEEAEEAEATCPQVIEKRTEKFGGDGLTVADIRIKLGGALAGQGTITRQKTSIDEYCRKTRWKQKKVNENM